MAQTSAQKRVAAQKAEKVAEQVEEEGTSAPLSQEEADLAAAKQAEEDEKAQAEAAKLVEEEEKPEPPAGELGSSIIQNGQVIPAGTKVSDLKLSDDEEARLKRLGVIG